MRVYYQVEAGYKIVKSKGFLVSLSLRSTSRYYPFLVSSNTAIRTVSYFFNSVREAQDYIKYVLSRHPDSTVPWPVLDAEQLTLF